MRERLGRSWYKYSRNPLSVVGLVVVVSVCLLAILAPIVAPYPGHAGATVDFVNAKKPPGWEHLFGTDTAGRDVLSRVIFAYRSALLMGVMVLALAAPLGVVLGLIGGYYRGTWIETVIMRTTDVFLSVPALVLALAIAAVLKPNLFNGMMAVSVMWWPWYTRLVYGLASSYRNEYFVLAARGVGASAPQILTKMSLDFGFIILIGATLSFVGLGEQPPSPGLGTMVSEGARNLPNVWWMAVFPALAIIYLVLGCNLLGDGVRDMLAAEEV
jgi:peptide/nickel transport system permease protein